MEQAAVPDTLIQHEIVEGIAWLTLNRPPLNILTISMIHELEVALDTLATSEPRATALVLAGNEKTFCAGVDVADHTRERVETMIRSFARLFVRLRTMPMPTVAMVQGPALGGGTELALGCDLVLASSSARFGQPEIKLGVFAPIAAVLFPRLIGYQQAARLLLTGEVISAEEAWRLGLVTHLAADDETQAKLEGLLAQLRSMSAAALHMTKRALLMGTDASVAEVLPSIENLYLSDLMLTADAREGIEAFLEKRPPIWRDC
jgi:cyclohexa-1,5-dienecarbonyl-CoA hydratase